MTRNPSAVTTPLRDAFGFYRWMTQTRSEAYNLARISRACAHNVEFTPYTGPKGWLP